MRHNQVGVQDQKWPPPPDSIHHGHTREPITCSLATGQSVSVDRHFSSKALRLWNRCLFSASPPSREL